LVNIREIYRFDAVENENKEYIIDLLEELLDADHTICTCEQCILDIVAITLNELQPRYRVGILGSIDIDQRNYREYQDTLVRALQYAVMRVTENPHHSVIFTRRSG